MAGLAFFTACSVALFSACSAGDKPAVTYMPDMAYSPAVKAQEEGGMRLPVPGTVARGHLPYPYTKEPERAGEMLKNPLPRRKAIYQEGHVLFETYCMVCHGPMGEGDGTIVPKFPRPPSLHSDKVRDWPDGRIFHVITQGQSLMPSYASQVPEEDRWKIVHYLRALQRAKNPEMAK